MGTLQKNKMKKIIIAISISLIFILFFIAFISYEFSPYKHSEKYSYKNVVDNTVVINEPIDSVFRMLGHSSYARQWSVFVHHITPLNSNEVADGTPGSTRRCYTQEDEKGIVWDEKILIVEPNQRRRLSIYNTKGFESESNDLFTEQLYEKIDSNTTKLTFVVFRDESKNMEWWKQALLYYIAYDMKTIFENNMENIKYLAEEGSNYHRRHELKTN